MKTNGQTTQQTRPNGGNFAKNKFNQQKGRQQMLMKRMIKWHKQRVTDFPKNDGKSSLNRDQITQLRAEALQLLKTDIWIYEQQKSSGNKSDDFEWIKNVLSNGTVNDKLAAHTVLIQDSAIHNLRSIENVIKFINPKGKRECVLAIDNLRDLFVGDLLIPKEKLSTFEDLIKEADVKWLLGEDGKYRDGQQTDRERFLVVSHFEDQVRANYKKFIDSLVVVGQDSLETMKIKSIRTLFDLFISNGEQERHLLSSLVNKLGDPLPKIASKTAHLLSEILLKHHPAMKTIIVKEVERLLFRPNATDRSQYYCLCFLTEIMFRNTGQDVELANHIIGIYLSLFNNLIKVGEVNNKMMAMILTGVSRAFPYSKLEAELLEKHLITFYKIIHYVNINTGIQTLSLIMNIVNFRESGSLTDRFYAVLYRFCTNSQLDQCHKTNTLLNVIFQAMKKDPVIKRIRAFSKRLAQYALISYAPFTISVLVLISEVLKQREGFRLESNILIQKRSATNTSAERTNCDSTFSISDDAKNENNDDNDEDDDDDVEIYYDAPEDDDENNDEAVNEKTAETKQKNLKDETENKKKCLKENEINKSEQITASWIHIKNQKALSSNKNFIENNNSEETTSRGDAYQMDARNPLYANADKEEFWELFTLSKHYHPTTRMFSDTILENRSIQYDGNPLDDFTVKRFLDRFVFRNPKTDIKNNRLKNVFSRKQQAQDKVFSPKELLEMDENDVPVDQKYIYHYLTQRKALKLKTKTGFNDGDDDGSDVESVNSDEFNEALDNMENDGDIDFADNFKKNYKNKKLKNNNNSDDEDYDDEDSFGDDVDFDEEFDDDDFSGHESDEDLNDSKDDIDEYDDDFAEMDSPSKINKKSINAAPFVGKKGFSKITNDIFESAQEFSNILDNNESDSDFEMEQSTSNNNSSTINKDSKVSLSAKSIQRAANKKLSLKRKRMGRDGHKNIKKNKKKIDL